MKSNVDCIEYIEEEKFDALYLYLIIDGDYYKAFRCEHDYVQ